MSKERKITIAYNIHMFWVAFHKAQIAKHKAKIAKADLKLQERLENYDH